MQLASYEQEQPMRMTQNLQNQGNNLPKAYQHRVTLNLATLNMNNLPNNYQNQPANHEQKLPKTYHNTQADYEQPTQNLLIIYQTQIIFHSVLHFSCFCFVVGV